MGIKAVYRLPIKPCQQNRIRDKNLENKQSRNGQKNRDRGKYIEKKEEEEEEQLGVELESSGCYSNTNKSKEDGKRQMNERERETEGKEQKK